MVRFAVRGGFDMKGFDEAKAIALGVREDINRNQVACILRYLRKCHGNEAADWFLMFLDIRGICLAK